MKVRMLTVALLLAAALLAGVAAATPEEDHADAIRALGVTNIVVKNPGYFFYGGEYIPPPYIVTREGDYLKINDRYIRFFCKWPQPKLRKWHVTYKMPEVPPSVTEKTSRFDPDVQDYWNDCFDYWLTTHAPNDTSLGAAVIVAGMRKLPCVKDAFIGEHGDAMIVWAADQYTNSCIFTAIADNPSCWDPPPVDPNAYRIGGDEEAVELAEQISGGNYLFWPLKNGGPWLTGSNLEPEFDKVLKNIDKCSTAEELSAACGRPWTVDLCADLLKHKDSFDAGLRKRINARVAVIEAEKRAERERKEKDAAARKRAAVPGRGCAPRLGQWKRMESAGPAAVR